MKENTLKPIMFVGTGSDVGKSVLNAGFCRILLEEGFRPAPFKAQNMSLNSYATPDGLEIGRAQAVQAEACKIPCETDMNPILLKPTTDKSSQVVLHGKPIGNQTAREYFLSGSREGLFEEAVKSFQRLEKKYSPIVMEGAGSISELNLKHRDVTNMRMAVATSASVYLVSDIDKGGVFASIYGSIMLLDEVERKRIKGIIINKFRGDITLFEEGKKIIKDLTGIPVVGVVSYFENIHIEEEDSVSLSSKNYKAIGEEEQKINIAVILIGKMSNFTDFSYLEKNELVNLYYTKDPKEVEKAQIVILPGSKNTITDLIEIKNNGIAEAVQKAFKNGKSVYGVCGGYQMMGQRISDPDEIEGKVKEVLGLGILPIETVITKSKKTEVSNFTYKDNQEEACQGYEIHMGETEILDKRLVNHLNIIEGTNEEEGCLLNDKVWGTYFHGVFDNKCVINDILAPFTDKESTQEDYTDFKEKQYQALSQHLRESMDWKMMIKELKEI